MTTERKAVGQYFALDYTGVPFILFGSAHLAALGTLAGAIFLLVYFGKRRSLNQRKKIRYGLGCLLIVNELSYHAWNIIHHQWSWQWHLPLHLCSLFVWASAFMLFTKNRVVFQFAYFLGISAALQPLLTPDAGRYGFPHFYPVQLFISHGSIIAAAVFMAGVEGFRPRISSVWQIALWSNVYLFFVTLINLGIGSNYLYTLHKPHIPTLLDYLGPWPWYLLSAQGIALTLFGVLYLPYGIANYRASKSISANIQ